MSVDDEVDMDNLCYGCLYATRDSNVRPCNTCINWVDGYLTATNYKNGFKVKGEIEKRLDAIMLAVGAQMLDEKKG